MQTGIHPDTHLCKVTCTCGNTFFVISVEEEMSVGLCSNCHPFYTGQQKFVDTAGRVDRFAQRYKMGGDDLKNQAKKQAKVQKRKKGKFDASLKINPKKKKEVVLKDEKDTKGKKSEDSSKS